MRDAAPDTTGSGSTASDSDHDGLCDKTETELGTNPHSADSDHDGIPDLIEIANGFDPSDPNSPAADQLADLVATPGASIDFSVHLTIDGDGQGASGVFQAISAIYSDNTTAEDFFKGSIAVTATPSDAARDVDAQGARFDAVLGHTLLTYSIHFEYESPDAGTPSCKRAYPFRYSVKGDDGAITSERLFVLVVSPAPSAKSASAAYCLPLGCQ